MLFADDLVLCETSREKVEQELERWRDQFDYVSGVMCDKNMPIKLKNKIYKTIVKPAMIYGSECWAVKKNDTQKLHTTEMRMLRWARCKTNKDHIKNEDIWREANVEPMTTFLRKKRLRWYGHVLRNEGEDTTKNMLIMQVQWQRRRGGPRKDGWSISWRTWKSTRWRKTWHNIEVCGTWR